jgi:hypothetical protein
LRSNFGGGLRRLRVSSIPTVPRRSDSAPRLRWRRTASGTGDAEPTVHTDMNAPRLGDDVSGRHSVLRITVARSVISCPSKSLFTSHGQRPA